MADKVVKNPQRAQAKYTPYTPQYKVLGFTPEKMDLGKSNGLTANAPVLLKSNKRTETMSHPPMKTLEQDQDYSEASFLLPDVGNGSHVNWSTIDNLIVDDLTDEVEELDAQNIPEPPATERELPVAEEVDLKTEEYLMYLDGELYLAGDLEFVETKVKQLLFGEHNFNRSFSPEDISVYKKVQIKVGVFIAE